MNSNSNSDSRPSAKKRHRASSRVVVGVALTICLTIFSIGYDILGIRAVSNKINISNKISNEPSSYFRNANTNTISTTTAKAKAKAKAMESIPPSKMTVHYHEMWNHTTSTIDIPEKYKNPFNSITSIDGVPVPPPRTSLEILQNVLHGDQYRAEFEAVEVYMNAISRNANANATDTETPTIIPTCLVPDVGATRELANRVVEARRSRIRGDGSVHKNQQPQRKLKGKWPYEELVLSLPVLNGEDTRYIITNILCFCLFL